MFLSFRTKLILVMSAVVAGASIGTSILTQNYVRRVYQQKFNDDFKAEVNYFSRLQLNRLEDVRRHCRKLAMSAPLVDAVTKRDVSAIRTDVLAELKDVLAASTPLAPTQRASSGGAPSVPGRPGQGPAARPDLPLLRELERPTITVVDPDGEVICAFDSDLKRPLQMENKPAFGRRSNRFNDGDKQRDGARGQFRANIRRLASGVDNQQEIAYAIEKGAGGKGHLLEQIVTPVLAAGEPAGAIIVSVMTSDMGERALHSFSEQTDGGNAPPAKKSRELNDSISSGFWLDGKLHSETIPERVRDLVADEVGRHLQTGKHKENFFNINLPANDKGDSVPCKILFRVLNPDSPFPPACQVAIYPLKTEIAEERELMQKISSVGLLALALALLLILFFSRGLTRPIHELVDGTAAIRQGNYHVKVPVRSHDEMGQLAASFNEMADGLQLNQKYQRLLSQVTDRMVAEQLINSGEAALGGELREVTVLFCDIRGFTTLTAGMPPHDVISLLNEHMTALTSLVHQDSGVVDKFVGDMVMAIFGAPFAYGDDAYRAAQCALRMVDIRDQLNKTGKWQFQVGIGIATGTVVAGCMGSDERLDYTVLGERVNLASRLCGNAGEGCILIDDTTRERLGDLAVVTEMPGLALKGYAEEVTAYRLTALSPALEHHETVHEATVES